MNLRSILTALVVVVVCVTTAALALDKNNEEQLNPTGDTSELRRTYERYHLLTEARPIGEPGPGSLARSVRSLRDAQLELLRAAAAVGKPSSESTQLAMGPA
jgi:hypothetical protein